MKAPGHPEVEDGPGAAVELEPEVLAVPPHRRHAPPAERAGEARRAHALEDDGIAGAAHRRDAAAAGHALDEPRAASTSGSSGMRRGSGYGLTISSSSTSKTSGGAGLDRGRGAAIAIARWWAGRRAGSCRPPSWSARLPSSTESPGSAGTSPAPLRCTLLSNTVPSVRVP